MPAKKIPRETPSERQENYMRVFDSSAGQAVLLDLCHEAGITKYNPECNHEALLIQKGAQRIVFGILSILNTDPRVILEQAQRTQTRKYAQDDE